MVGNPVHADASPGIATLIGGIVNDVRDLLKQELEMFQQELQEDFIKTRKAVTMLAMGLVMALVAGMLISVTLALLVNHLWPQVPLWAAFAGVGLAWTALAGGLVFVGIKKFDSFNPLPDQTLQTVKENVQWLTKK